jgi:hypothetical protein
MQELWFFGNLNTFNEESTEEHVDLVELASEVIKAGLKTQ